MHARTLITLAIAAILGAGARAQDAVSLLRTARVEPGRPLLLGDIARVEGPEAERLGALVLIEDPAREPADARGWFRIDTDRVRDALEAELGEGAGMVALSGAACDVQAVAPARRAPAPPAPGARDGAATDATALAALDTIRGSVAREIARILRTEPASLRLEFEPSDAEFLDLPAAGRTLQVSAVGAADRMPMAVTLFEANGRATRRTVRVGVQVLREVAVVSRVLARGAPIEQADLAAERRWVAPTDRPVTPEAALGAVTKRRIDPGELLAAHLIEPPIMVHRGDLVQVRVFCAGLIVRRAANATADAREGEIIEFAAQHFPKQRFRAMVVGRGQATVVAPEPAGTALASETDAG